MSDIDRVGWVLVGMLLGMVCTLGSLFLLIAGIGTSWT